MNTNDVMMASGLGSSLMGHQSHVRMTPEELARLDTSITNFLNTYTIPSISLPNLYHRGNNNNNNNIANGNNVITEGIANVDSGADIGAGLTAGKLMSSQAMAGKTPATPFSIAAASTRPFPPTPPQSSPLDAVKTHLNATTLHHNQQGELKRLYEERIEVMKRNEQERLRIVEEEHRATLARLKGDHEALMKQYEQLRREKDLCERQLKEEINRLNKDLNRMSVIDDPPPSSRNLKSQYEQRIADLIAEFDREKKASNKILQSKVRSQLALLIPKLRTRVINKVERECHKRAEAMIAKNRQECADTIKKLREDHALERRIIIKQAKEDAELHFKEWQAKMREKMRLKLMQVRNEAERTVLERLGRK